MQVSVSECQAEACSCVEVWINDAAVKQVKEVVTPTVLGNWQGFWLDLMTLPSAWRSPIQGPSVPQSARVQNRIDLKKIKKPEDHRTVEGDMKVITGG